MSDKPSKISLLPVAGKAPINPNVSEYMLEQASTLRTLASLIESGVCVGIASAWVTKPEGETEICRGHTFSSDTAAVTLIGEVALLARDVTLEWRE